ncbi:MAG: hypothetical protein AAF570_25995, partial [Bacteroidota bacterium]
IGISGNYELETNENEFENRFFRKNESQLYHAEFRLSREWWIGKRAVKPYFGIGLVGSYFQGTAEAIQEDPQQGGQLEKTIRLTNSQEYGGGGSGYFGIRYSPRKRIVLALEAEGRAIVQISRNDRSRTRYDWSCAQAPCITTRESFTSSYSYGLYAGLHAQIIFKL